MCALSIKLVQPVVEISLKFLNTRVDLLSKCYLIELVENGFMESPVSVKVVARRLWVMLIFCYRVSVG